VCDYGLSRPLPARHPQSSPFSGSRVVFDPAATGTEITREVDEPLPTAAPPWHPPIEAPVAKFYDEPFSELDREAAEVCFKVHCVLPSPPECSLARKPSLCGGVELLLTYNNAYGVLASMVTFVVSE